jgi:PAS domain S-box-containing protein
MSKSHILKLFAPTMIGVITGPIRSNGATRLGLASLLGGISVWLSVLLGGSVGPGVFPFLFPICLISVWFGGILAGILVTLILALGAAYYHLPPQGWAIRDRTDVIGLLVFVLSGVLVSWIVDSLQRSHSLLRAVLTSIGDAVITTDREHSVRFMNPQAETLTGWFKREAEKKSIAQVLKVNDLKETQIDVKGLLAQAMQEGRPVKVPPRSFLARKSGTPLPVDDSIAPIQTRMGKVCGAVVVFRDDTTRRQSEQALIEAEARYREIFESAVVGMFQSTLQGRYLRVNRAMASMHGYESPEHMVDEVADIWQQEFADPNQRVSFERLLREHMAVRAFPLETVRRDGTRLSIVINARLVRDTQGNALYYEGTQEDVTDRKRLEAQVEQAQRLEAVGRLAGGIAHDFNNLLGVIIGYCSLAEQKLSASDPAAQFIRQIKAAGDRGAALIRQLLALSRKQVVQPTVLDLNEVILELSPMLERMVGEDIAISFHLAAELGLILADFRQLEQVLMNFAANARDAMPIGGTIKIETRNIELDYEYTKQHTAALQGPHVMLSFSDSGHGIDKAALPHIFEPFFTTKESGKGTGLGLATVYGIVKQNDGDIWVYSEVGHGTTFKIYFPRTDELLTPRSRSDTLHEGGTETILIVEDDAELLDVVAKMLKSGGYRVQTAMSEAAALEIVERSTEKVDLLLTDVVMRGISGPALSAKIQLARPATRVLYMSGYVGDKLRDYGPLEVLEKPFTKNDLLGRVRAALNRA